VYVSHVLDLSDLQAKMTRLPFDGFEANPCQRCGEYSIARKFPVRALTGERADPILCGA
jgi:hypothetical protein